MNAEVTPFAAAIEILEEHWYTPAELAEYLNAPQPQLGGKSAIEALAEGRAADVLASVRRLDDGVYL